ncbi:MAG: pyruvate, water dikinase regulatory protein [Bacteroidota bacterium]|nr:pyruvate, water dikinase regulatory protein [Bacteroidota bacterium]
MQNSKNSSNSDNKICPKIFIVSGGKGLSGTNVVRSVLIQFPEYKCPIKVVPDVNSKQIILETVEKAKTRKGVIVHTMVDPVMRKEVIRTCEEHGVPNFDIVGGLSDYLSESLDTQPLSKPGLYRLSNIEYFRRVEAIEFTMKHDDGLNVHRLSKADIILTGVSRTGKTPLSIYLGMFGWRVANVPIILGHKPPEELFEVDSRRVFGLITMTNYLITQRTNRIREMGLSDDHDYINPRKVRMELDYAKNIFAKGGFHVLKVTHRPIETNANEIVSILDQHFGAEKMRVSS